MVNSDDILIDVQNVSKKFCRDFKKSLWYGVQDTASDLFRRNKGQASPEADTTNTPNLPHSSFQNSSFPPSLREGEFWANQNISFSVRRGECLGLIGHNGAGKTTLLKMLNGLIKPDTGTITMKGRIGALIALGAGFNPILTGRENIYVNGSILGLSKKEIDAKLDEIIDFAEIEEAIDAPVRTYSSGMQVRLGFAVASFMDPDILLVDEVLAVGDLSFKNKCSQRMQAFRNSGGSLILVSHSMHSIQSNCEQTVLLDQGKIVACGETSESIAVYNNLQLASPEKASEEGTLGTAGDYNITSFTAAPCEGDKIFPNQAINLTLEVESREVRDNVYFVFIIQQTDGSYITSCAAGTRTDETTLHEGTSRFHAHIEHLPLCPGTYLLAGGLWAKGQGNPIVTIGYDDPPAKFQVHASGSPADNSHAANGDLVHMDSLGLTWGSRQPAEIANHEA